MDASEHDTLIAKKRLPRKLLLELLAVALDCDSRRFARQTALSWLAVYPGDLQVGLFLGRVLALDGKQLQATRLVEKLCRLDPEFLAAYQALAGMAAGDPALQQNTLANVSVLGGETPPDYAAPEWARLLSEGRALMEKGQLEQAEEQVHRVLGVAPYQMLAAVFHVKLTRARQDFMTAYRLASLYHERWPDCLHFTLCLAEARMEIGDETGAVQLLHRCVNADSAGQVAEHLWGGSHAYRPLWPDALEIAFDQPIPAPVAVRMGWNQLPQGEMPANGEPASPPAPEAGERPKTAAGVLPRPAQPKSETVRLVEEELERLAHRLNQPAVGRVDGRFPVYVIFSTRSGLYTRYGQAGLAAVEKEIDNLAGIVRRRPGWGALVFYADDPACTGRLGVKAVEPDDPWKLKLALVDLDQALAKKGEMIGALLIVGGAEVVPFHHLPNPTDDADENIDSDNPYATLDSNYFVPEWPVGRLPGDASGEAGVLLAQLTQVVRYHTRAPRKTTWWQQMLERLQWMLRPSLQPGNFGYSAAVWQRSSLAAFRPIGEAQSLLTSPPERSGSFETRRLMQATLGYYNLHGVEDAAEWFGQRDQLDAVPGPDYPVALRPDDLHKNGHAPSVVFSEACYGGYIYQKKVEQSIALKFLTLGTQAVVASTRISYGSVTTPLIGADLLGSLFWRHLRDGLPAGAALMQAKLDLAREMNKRQGFLDGEDQKTLLSFVLYGDPLATADAPLKRVKSIQRLRSHPALKTVSDQKAGAQPPAAPRVPTAVLKQVQQIVEDYLPGAEATSLRVNPQTVTGQGSGARPGAKNSPAAAGERVVVTVSKQVQVAQRTHQHYARVTLDADGKMIKLALSR